MCELCHKEHRPLKIIAAEIKTKWLPEVRYSARPYLSAMHCLECVNDSYGADAGDTIVLYFLANAQTWRGPDARRIKKELNELLNG